MNAELSTLRQALSSISRELKACQTHVRGISAYRSDADGLAYAVNKFKTATDNLHRVAGDLNALASELLPARPASAGVKTDNGRKKEELDKGAKS